MRVCVTVNPRGDRKADLRTAAAARAALLTGAEVWDDPDHPLRGIHRDVEGRCYFEYGTDDPAAVGRVLEALPFAARLAVTLDPPPPGEGCQNCGNVSGPTLASVCPNCGFRDIDPCPNTRCPAPEVPRQEYRKLGRSLFQCPVCEARVRFRYNEPMFLSDGSFNPPLVVTELAEPVAVHNTR